MSYRTPPPPYRELRSLNGDRRSYSRLWPSGSGICPRTVERVKELQFRWGHSPLRWSPTWSVSVASPPRFRHRPFPPFSPSRLRALGSARVPRPPISSLLREPRPGSVHAPSPPHSPPSALSPRRSAGSRTLPFGSPARSPRPLTWQRRHQPCWPGGVLRGGRGRGGAGRDCSAAVALGRLKGPILHGGGCGRRGSRLEAQG